MRNTSYFKRIKYEKEIIAAKPFESPKLEVSSEHLTFLPVHEFVEQKTQAGEGELLERIFNYDKSEREQNCGLGKVYTDEVLQNVNAGHYINFEKGYDNEHSVMLKYHLDEKNDVLFEKTFIEVQEGVKAKLVIYYSSEKAVEAYKNSVITIDIKDHAELELIRVHNLGVECRSFETVKVHTGFKSKFNNYTLDLGSKVNASSITYYVPKDWAEVAAFPLYFVDGERKMDLEQVLVINGQNSLCEISAKGALKDKARKVFRGNIFLNRHCRRSIGRFGDANILLNKGVVAHSIPTIFCDEDDVIGEHAASFEPINKDKLYYMTSRGIDELEAKKLMISSNFRPVINMIEDEAIREYLNNELDARLQF